MDDMTDIQKQNVKDFYLQLDSIRAHGGDLTEIYAKYAKNYDCVIGNTIVTESVFDNFSRRVIGCFMGLDVSQILLIDIGSGTGRLGESLARHGFKNIHSLDSSAEMIEVSKSKNLYTDFFNVPLLPTPTPGIIDNTYDGAVSTGSFVEGHISMTALEEVVRIVKPNGFIIFTVYDPKFTLNYMEILGKLMKDRKIELISMILEPYKREFSLNFKFVNGYTIVLQVTKQ